MSSLKLTQVGFVVLLAVSTVYCVLSTSICNKRQERRLSQEQSVEFIVALAISQKDNLHDHLLDISNPKSHNYGKYLSIEQIRAKYGPSNKVVNQLSSYFKAIPTSVVTLSESGDMFKVKASVEAIESIFQTELELHNCLDTTVDNDDKSGGKSNTDVAIPALKLSIRSKNVLTIPNEIKQHIAFVSLDIPTYYVATKGKTYIQQQDANELNLMQQTYNSDRHPTEREEGQHSGSKAQEDILSIADEIPRTFTASATTGNEEAVIRFNVICPDGSYNSMNPPCISPEGSRGPMPTFTAKVTMHAELKSNPFQLNTQPIEYVLTENNIYCYSVLTFKACSGYDGRNCTCITKLSPLPKYTQLRASIYISKSPTEEILLGRTSLFALTDVANIPFLSNLYGVPKGLIARHGATQAVAEFYGEFYSNKDLREFLELSGLPGATLPESLVRGNNPNNEANPGAEATLDVEYIMGMAPQAKTLFYSFSDRNPYSYENEGFLAFLFVIGSERNPPSVLSMSYGDIEASVFNSTRRGAAEYGARCDIEFMKLGLRGVTILFSSGDDGIGNTVMRRNKALGCSRTWPGWPASSPYVTAIGATQLTDRATPICGKLYSPGLSGTTELTQIVVKCTEIGETACSAINGCVITTGGGFSDIYDRDIYAPWQSDFVETYLANPASVHSSRGVGGSFPDLLEMDDFSGGDRLLMEEQLLAKQHANGADFRSNKRLDLLKFNMYGRGYPDVSAYGSNFFVVLNGRLIRESGTSASAPVIAAMVTLWNDMRLANGLPVMGFLNPTLYEVARSTPEAYNDVTTGNNACGVGRSLETAPCCDNAFASTPGWDATTGLGTINYGVFANLIINNRTFFPALASFKSDVDNSNDTNSSVDVSSRSDFTFTLALASLSISIALCLLYLQSTYFSKASQFSLHPNSSDDRNGYAEPTEHTYLGNVGYQRVKTVDI